ARAAVRLDRVLVDHASPGRACRVSERLEPAVGVQGPLPAELERAARDVLLRLALLAKAEIFVGEQLGEREAVVQLHDVELAERLRGPRPPGGGLCGRGCGGPGPGNADA